MILSIVTFVKCEDLEEFIASVESFLDNLQRYYQICHSTGMECDVRKLEQYITICTALSSVLLAIREAPRLVVRIVADFATVFGNANIVFSKTFQIC